MARANGQRRDEGVSRATGKNSIPLSPGRIVRGRKTVARPPLHRWTSIYLDHRLDILFGGCADSVLLFVGRCATGRGRRGG